MTTRSGTPFHRSQDQPSSSMDPSMESLMKSMLEQMATMNTKLDRVEDRIGVLEEARLTQTEPPSPRLPPDNPRAQR